MLPNTPQRVEILVSSALARHNQPMKGIVSIVVVAATLLGMYYSYLKRLPKTDVGTASTQAISLTGVRSDLLQIGQTERSNIALNGKCDSFDDMVSSGALTMSRSGRDGYTYHVACSGGSDFQVVAEHPSAPADSGIRYPKLAIDSAMQIQEVQ